MINSKDIVDDLISKAKKAQSLLEKLTQEKIDEIVTAIAWAVCKPSSNKKISEQAVKDTGLGNVDDKILKNRRKTIGLLRDLKNVKTIGVINEDIKKGIIEIAKPIGIVGAVTPSTNPAATPINNIINAVKCRNSIIISPSPSGSNVFKSLLNLINNELKKLNAPENLVQTFGIVTSVYYSDFDVFFEMCNFT